MMGGLKLICFALACLLGLLCDKGCGCCFSAGIAFEAFTTKTRGHFSHGKTLIFPDVSLNHGQGYDPKTGIFEAPVSGVYHFTMHVCSPGGKHMVVGLFKGSEKIAVTTVYEGTYSSCTSHSANAKVKKHESVFVKALWSDSNLQSNIYRWPSFSGFLLFESE